MLSFPRDVLALLITLVLRACRSTCTVWRRPLVFALSSQDEDEDEDEDEDVADPPRRRCFILLSFVAVCQRCLTLPSVAHQAPGASEADQMKEEEYESFDDYLESKRRYTS